MLATLVFKCIVLHNSMFLCTARFFFTICINATSNAQCFKSIGMNLLKFTAM